jgi:hypothetical protein
MLYYVHGLAAQAGEYQWLFDENDSVVTGFDTQSSWGLRVRAILKYLINGLKVWTIFMYVLLLLQSIADPSCLRSFKLACATCIDKAN